jgi:hypothetical protein
MIHLAPIGQSWNGYARNVPAFLLEIDPLLHLGLNLFDLFETLVSPRPILHTDISSPRVAATPKGNQCIIIPTLVGPS